MMLADGDILKAKARDTISVEPFDPELVQPGSYDVRLADTFRVIDQHRHTVIDPRLEQHDLMTEVVVAPGRPLMLHPGQFVLGSTVEKISISAWHGARLEGKSSLGRLGLMTHSTAGFIDPGFSGTITLELSNVSSLPILLWPGMRIGQVCFFQMVSPADHPYGSPALGSKYQGQDGPTPSRAFLDTEVGPATDRPVS